MLRKICTEKLNAQMPQATERISLLFYKLFSIHSKNISNTNFECLR